MCEKGSLFLSLSFSLSLLHFIALLLSRVLQVTIGAGEAAFPVGVPIAAEGAGEKTGCCFAGCCC